MISNQVSEPLFIVLSGAKKTKNHSNVPSTPLDCFLRLMITFHPQNKKRFYLERFKLFLGNLLQRSVAGAKNGDVAVRIELLDEVRLLQEFEKLGRVVELEDFAHALGCVKNKKKKFRWQTTSKRQWEKRNSRSRQVTNIQVIETDF